MAAMFIIVSSCATPTDTLMAKTSGILCRAPREGPIPVTYIPKQDNEHPHPSIGKCPAPTTPPPSPPKGDSM